MGSWNTNPPEFVEKIRHFAEQKMSAQQIAKLLDVTRSKVLGLARRKGIQLEGSVKGMKYKARKPYKARDPKPLPPDVIKPRSAAAAGCGLAPTAKPRKIADIRNLPNPDRIDAPKAK